MRKRLSEDLAGISSDTFLSLHFLQNLKSIVKKQIVGVLAFLSFLSFVSILF